MLGHPEPEIKIFEMKISGRSAAGKIERKPPP
jgi:hypothetical protein